MADSRRIKLEQIADNIRLKHRFDELADLILPGEGFADEAITDGMVRSLASRFDSREELRAWVDAIAETRFEETA